MLPCHEGRTGTAYAMPDVRAMSKHVLDALAFDMRLKGQAIDLSRHVLDAGRQLITHSRRCGPLATRSDHSLAPKRGGVTHSH